MGTWTHILMSIFVTPIWRPSKECASINMLKFLKKKRKNSSLMAHSQTNPACPGLMWALALELMQQRADLLLPCSLDSGGLTPCLVTGSTWRLVLCFVVSCEPRCHKGARFPTERDKGEAWELKHSRQPLVETVELWSAPESLPCFCHYSALKCRWAVPLESAVQSCCACSVEAEHSSLLHDLPEHDWLTGWQGAARWGSSPELRYQKNVYSCAKKENETWFYFSLQTVFCQLSVQRPSSSSVPVSMCVHLHRSHFVENNWRE